VVVMHRADHVRGVIGRHQGLSVLSRLSEEIALNCLPLSWFRASVAVSPPWTERTWSHGVRRIAARVCDGRRHGLEGSPVYSRPAIAVPRSSARALVRCVSTGWALLTGHVAVSRSAPHDSVLDSFLRVLQSTCLGRSLIGWGMVLGAHFTIGA
jgi:hypothetical protein